MTLALLLAAIVAWSPNLRDDDAAGEAEKIAAAVMAGAERESLDPLVVAAVIAQESGFDADPCNRRVALDRVISREPVEGHADREQLSWTCGSSAGTRRTCERTVWQVEEHDGYLYLDTCPAGEVGYMQVLRSSEWARAGYAIPGTEFDATGQVDGLLRCFTFNIDPVQNRVAVTLAGERLARSAFVVDQTDASVCLDDVPAAGASLVFAEALSTSAQERREQLINARINIALGCAELAAHREGSGMTSADPWWKWIGSYNTGTHRGPAARRYARRIVGRYLELCDLAVPTDAGDVPLRDVYPACAEASAASDDLAENARSEAAP
jgi:hypothetical protein